MDRRLARSLAIIVVITVLGGILLADRADRLARRRRALEARAAAEATAAAAATPNPDSARAVAAATAAYDADRVARGEPPLATRVFAFTPDSAGVLVTLFPRQPILGQDAVVRVTPDGQARVVVRGQ